MFECYWYEKNLQGDVVAVYNSQGTKLASYRYTAYGDVYTTYYNGGSSTGAAKNPFKYRGYYYDSDLQLYYLRSRYYDPRTCRFISPDDVSYLGANGDLLSYNLYAYCSNDPVNYVDPSGRWSENKGLLNNDIVDHIRNTVQNESEEAVLKSQFISFYKGKLVLRMGDDFGLSYGIIILGKGDRVTDEVLKHEYGHALQFDKMGLIRYTTDVALPSLTAWLIDRYGELPFDYYSSPWEKEANELGGSNLTGNKPNDPWTEEDGYFWDLVKLLFA